MNQIIISKQKINYIFGDVQTAASYYNFMMANSQIYIQDEFAFDDGVVLRDDGAPMFTFYRCKYNSYEKSEIGKRGFVIECMTSLGLTAFYYSISSSNIADVGLYVEAINDIAIKYFKDKSTEQIVFGFAYKIIFILDMIQRSALNCKTVLKKVPSEMIRNHHNDSCCRISEESSVIRLTNGITFRYVNQYIDKRMYERHAESWNVKGHYRHYKSGKTIFIKPFEKGGGKVNDKRYIL